MRTKSLIIGYVLALALFLFGQRHFTVPPQAVFHTVVDFDVSERGGVIGSAELRSNWFHRIEEWRFRRGFTAHVCGDSTGRAPQH